MLLDRLHHLASRASEHTDQTAEHQAVVELLVLVAYTDHRITQDELDALDAFDADHPGWDSGAFSTQQYLPAAIAKVRAALDHPDGAGELLHGAVARITTPAVRAETLTACTALAETDGLDDSESELLGRLRSALAAAPEA